MGHNAGQEREGEKRQGKKSRPVAGNWAKELAEYRNGFLIFRIYGLNEIRLNSNEFYLKPNYRAHINTKINASWHECNNQKPKLI
jgi:hypothetical protein